MSNDRAARIARQHLRTDQLLGVEAVPVGSNEGIAMSEPETSESGDTPAAAADAPASMFTPTLESIDTSEKLRLLTALDEQHVKGCTKCALCESRTNTVFGEGNPDADLMFIGEGPGQNEDEQGRPFVGRAGDLLDKMIVAIGMQREQVYIANVVKCRPPGNRTPTPAEVESCGEYLRQQIETIQPNVIVTLGGPAMKFVLGVREGITRLRGNWHEYAQVNPPIPVMPTFHPAYLLRSYTKENRQKVWSDLQAAVERLGKQA